MYLSEKRQVKRDDRHTDQNADRELEGKKKISQKLSPPSHPTKTDHDSWLFSHILQVLITCALTPQSQNGLSSRSDNSGDGNRVNLGVGGGFVPRDGSIDRSNPFLVSSLDFGFSMMMTAFGLTLVECLASVTWSAALGLLVEEGVEWYSLRAPIE